MQRIAKVISNAGICSRRDAEALILAGKVKVDNIIITSPAICVTDENKIEVSGQVILKQNNARLWTYYKPLGLITTHKDPQGRSTVFQQLVDLPRVISVGRLDINSEGLLLLTNNGSLARYFELPSNKIERIYKVRAYGNPDKVKAIKSSIIIDEITYNPSSIKLIQSTGTNSWFEVILTEGKNREIRKIFEHFGMTVNRLIRTKYGQFSLGDLNPGEYAEQSIEMIQDYIR